MKFVIETTVTSRCTVNQTLKALMCYYIQTEVTSGEKKLRYGGNPFSKHKIWGDLMLYKI
jgi:hypothetical protein